MNRILFPFDDDELPNDDKKGSTKWVGLDPLEMASRLALLAETKAAKSTLIERRSLPPLRIDTTFLSMENPELPPVPAAMRNMAIEEYDSTERTYFDSPEHQKAKKLSREKRERTVSSVYPVANSAHQMSPWDPSYLMKHNQDPFTSRYAVCQITKLAREFESSHLCEEFIPSYQRVKERLFEESNFISKSSKKHVEKVESFSKLYSSVIQQMQALIEMAKRMKSEGRVASKFFHDEVGTNEKKSQVDITTSTVEYSKRDFTEYMNNWLKENWTNPYPDDEGLAEIAAINGTSPTTVSNWLINARTRKWRPAIVKAYEAGRPADMLKDDSMNIFDGNDNTQSNINVVQP